MTKSCDLKGQQKLFFLNQNRASSCCKALPESLDHFESLDHLLAHWQQEAVDLDQGLSVTSCDVCWRKESQGQLSFRQMSRPVSNNWIELYVDNACNQMCSYCSPKFSTTWETSIQQHGPFKAISKTARQNLEILPTVNDTQPWLTALRQHIAQQPVNSVTVKLLGGEPLMQIKQLETLIEFNIDRVAQLRINTNLNPPNNKFLLWILQRVPAHRLFFDVSIDATPEFNHVPRAGFRADAFGQNLDMIRRAGIPYNFISTLSVLNLFDLENFVAWCRKHKHPFQVLPLNNPDCLDARLVPDQFRTEICPDPMPELVADVLKPTNTVVDIKLFEQYNYLQQYFDRANIQPDQTSNPAFGQYWQWLSERY